MTINPDLPTVAIELKDGSLASLRPLVPLDRQLLVEGLEHLSMDARIARFGMAIDHLSKSELDYLTQVDQVRHVAWGATIDDEPAGVGRYIVVPDSGCAEVAIVVVDEFRRRGLGRVLLQSLAESAKHNGVDRFCFMIQPDNRIVISMMKGLGADLGEDSGSIQGWLRVADIDPGPHAPEFLTLLISAQASGSD